jgi:Phosphodiester glycosidase/FlgD Ig-like domain
MALRLLTVAVLVGLLAAPAHAQGTELVPGVTYEKIVQFTPHGAVALHVITAPRPGDQNGLYQLAPVLGRGTILGVRENVTQLEKDVSAQATVAGINGDLWSASDLHPAGIVMTGGVLQHPPLAGRSSIGVDSSGVLHVDRVRFFGTWRGTGQRRPLNGVNQTPASGQVVLFTPAYGAAVPQIPGSAEVILQPFPAAVPNSDLSATVTAVGSEGGQQIPPDGAVLMATGTTAAKLAAEAPLGTPVTTRLILQPTWDGVVSALGGGPVLVKNGKAVFRSLEDFTNEQIAARDARAGIGQLADGRIVLVAVDGRQPGYSVGMTSFELAQTLQRLGAVTAAGVESGGAVTAAFDTRLLNRPSDPTGERAVREALLVEYFGVYAPPLTLPLLNGDSSHTVEPLQYKLVRPSTVTASLVGPDGVARVVENAVAHTPGVYSVPFTAYDVEGAWHWRVQATDDLGRTSVADRSFRYDTTLKGLTVPALARGRLTVRFTLSRPAKVRLRIETRTGVTMRDLPPASLPAGAQQVVWDGRLPQGTRAYGGSYVAHVFVTSTVGTSDLATPFAFRRVA